MNLLPTYLPFHPAHDRLSVFIGVSDPVSEWIWTGVIKRIDIYLAYLKLRIYIIRASELLSQFHSFPS
jgi:hypothetical protein